jgi:hypothetical protein
MGGFGGFFMTLPASVTGAGYRPAAVVLENV